MRQLRVVAGTLDDMNGHRTPLACHQCCGSLVLEQGVTSPHDQLHLTRIVGEQLCQASAAVRVCCPTEEFAAVGALVRRRAAALDSSLPGRHSSPASFCQSRRGGSFEIGAREGNQPLREWGPSLEEMG